LKSHREFQNANKNHGHSESAPGFVLSKKLSNGVSGFQDRYRRPHVCPVRSPRVHVTLTWILGTMLFPFFVVKTLGNPWEPLGTLGNPVPRKSTLKPTFRTFGNTLINKPKKSVKNVVFLMGNASENYNSSKARETINRALFTYSSKKSKNQGYPQKIPFFIPLFIIFINFSPIFDQNWAKCAIIAIESA
jgi:hypothetical protein